MLVSVIVPTYNRPEQIKDCLKSILANSFSNFEVIVVDQSDDTKTKEIVEDFRRKPVRYFKMRQKGKSSGLNFGIEKSGGKILAFTDDDCVADEKWLNNIHESLKENKNVAGVFGVVLPYKPNSYLGKVCPCTIVKKKKMIISSPRRHTKIGFGNNMAFKKEVFKKMGGFKTWLGAGSISYAAEDAEFTLRSLVNRYKLLYSPAIKIYHNRWLTKEEFREQLLFYSCGETACYGYFTLKGLKFGGKVVKYSFTNLYKKLKWGARLVFRFQKESLGIIRDALLELSFRLKGLLVAFWFFRKESMNLLSHKA